MLPSGGFFSKKKENKEKENKDVNVPEQNGLENDSQLNTSAESDKFPAEKKERSKVIIKTLIPIIKKYIDYNIH